MEILIVKCSYEKLQPFHLGPRRFPPYLPAVLQLPGGKGNISTRKRKKCVHQYLAYLRLLVPSSSWLGHNKHHIFIALIHPIHWTIANPVGADRPAKRQKKTSCVATGWPVPVLCTCQVAPRTSFLSRQSDVIASFSFGACTVQTCFEQCPDILRKSVDYDRFSTLYVNSLV